MTTALPIRLLALSAAAALAACAPKDGSSSTDQTTPAPADQVVAHAAPSTPASESTEMKGLDPAAPLSRTDMNNGLVIEDLKMGEGEIVWPSARVKLQIKGWSVATGKLYWDTAAQGGPKDIPLATAMKGIREGVPGMRVGGKRRLHVSADKAYGFSQPKNDTGEVVVPQGTPIVLEIEAVESLSKLSIETPAGSAAPRPSAAPQ